MLGDHPPAMLDEVDEHVEHLGLDVDRGSAAGQFEPGCVERAVGELIAHDDYYRPGSTAALSNGFRGVGARPRRPSPSSTGPNRPPPVSCLGVNPMMLEGGFDPRQPTCSTACSRTASSCSAPTVDDDIANQLCAQLLYLDAEDDTKDIWLYINSPGGSVTAGMAIYDTMQFVDCDVATVCIGLAASMGQFLLTAGAAGKRYSLPNARIMMHQPLAGLRGQAADIAIQAQELAFTKKRMAELIAQHSGHARSSRSRPTATATAGSPPRRPRSTASCDQVIVRRGEIR